MTMENDSASNANIHSTREEVLQVAAPAMPEPVKLTADDLDDDVDDEAVPTAPAPLHADAAEVGSRGSVEAVAAGVGGIPAALTPEQHVDAALQPITVANVTKADAPAQDAVAHTALFYEHPCIKWLGDRVSLALRGKTSKKWWRRCFQEPHARAIVEQFLGGETSQVYFYNKANRPWVIAQGPIPSDAGKLVVIWRHTNDTPMESVEALATETYVNNFHADCLKIFRLELEGIFIPYLLSGKSGINWPKVVQHNVISHAQKFASFLEHFEGLTKGKVVLSLPPDMPAIKAEMSTTQNDKTRRAIHIHETAIIQWSRHIRNILAQDSSQQLDHMEAGGSFPGATVELAFWAKRHENLRGVVKQLSSPRVRQVTQVLANANSAYIASFDNLMTELDVALVESRDIHVHLSTLRKPLEALESGAFHDIPGHLHPIFHLISLIWHTSAHYDSRRLKVFFRMLSNTVVLGVTKFLTATDLFSDASSTTVLNKLHDALSVASKFKEVFFLYRTRVNAQHSKPWRLEETTVFSRVDKILQRIRDLIEVFEVKNRFARLENFEPGGNRGTELHEVVLQVYKEFQEEALTWSNIVSGIIDPSSTAFEEAYTAFSAKVEKYDDRIALVVGKCFPECQAYQTLKLLEAIKDWKIRSVAVERETRLSELMAKVRNEIEVLFHQFESQKGWWEQGSSMTLEGRPIPFHVSCITGMHIWVNSLLRRVNGQVESLMRLSKRQFKTPEGHVVQNNVRIFEETLTRWRDACTLAWKTQVTTLCLDKLDQPLLRHLGGSGLLVVNFDKGLLQALEDVWSIQGFGVDLGHKIKTVFAQREEYRLAISRLEVVATQYNHVVETVIEVERPLIRKSLDHIHSILDEGLTDLTWRSPRTAEFVQKVAKSVTTLHGNMIYIKGNISTMMKIVRNWRNMHKVIHFSEEESWENRKKSILHELTEIWQGEANAGLSDSEKVARKWIRRWKDKVSLRLRSLDDILKQYKRIQRLIEASRLLLQVDLHSPAWTAYLEYVNNLFTAGFITAVKKTLEHLLKYLEGVRNLDSYGKVPERILRMKDVGQTLMNIRLQLRESEAEFDPSIHRDDFGSVQYRVYEWCNTVFEVGRQLPRLDDPANHYYVLLFDHPELNVLKDEILRLMLNTVHKLEAVRMDFLKYSYLWQDDIDTFVERFAAGNARDGSSDDRALTPEPFEDVDQEEQEDDDLTYDYNLFDVEEAKEEEDPEELPKKHTRPSIADFEQQIIKYKLLSEEIEGLPSSVNYGWIVLDTSLLKNELMRLSSEWRNRFLAYQKRRLITNLTRFNVFVSKTERGIAIDSLEQVDEYSELVSVMKHLARFQAHTTQFDQMFEPAKNVVVLLKKHDIPLPTSVLQDVENAPVLWRDLKKKCFLVNEMLAPRQMEEVAKIRLMEHNFECRSQNFYSNTFQKKQPTSLAIPPRLAYKAISELHVMVLNLEYQLKELQEKQALFQLMPSPGRAVRSCRTDLLLLKYLWDSAAIASYQMEAWNHVPCTLVDIDEMKERVGKLVSMIKDLDKRVRRWDVYHEIEAKAKNFLISLPLIESLRAPAMRPIHWEELMNKTGVHFSFKDLTIENLISLNLHKFPDEVTLIVGKAVRQAQIEEQLEALDSEWNMLTLQFDTQAGVDYPTFTVPDEVQVTIEEHQLILQGLSQKRFVSEYIAHVQQWQKTLATVESVLGMFVEVQRTWRYLQSIFIGSDDIKSQLPQHTQLFLELDMQVKQLLREASQNPKIVDLCCNEGRENTLLTLQTQLASCGRALDGYMDQKRKTFPRFYFVSTPHLLEILSKTGKSPEEIMEHIPRVLQDVQSFALKDGYMASGIRGKGGEEFDLTALVDCRGRIEQYLQGVVDSIAQTLFTMIEQAILTYSGKSKTQWLDQYISQVAVVVSRVHWTVDVSSTFHAMEEGNENALKEQLRRCQENLQELVAMVPNTELTAVIRRRVMNLVIQGVHQVDVIHDLIAKKADTKSSFSWQRQLRHRLNDKARGVVAEICDCQYHYGGEYHGDAVRIVITPLTERVYITLTQSIRMKMSGAAFGPAGTGKTETVKDLAKQLGMACYVFNCSEQMTARTLGGLFKGLTSGGVWGCFDEFNRIRLSVLSVVALQFKHIFDAQRQNQKEYLLGADEVTLDPQCSIFVTMNPGYIGRTELPGNLKALFRPVAVVEPDRVAIHENLLLAEGFEDARRLARKFDRLFKICAASLSRQAHYCWGMRSMRSLLFIAGVLKRSRPDMTEEMVLMQVLTDYTLPKLVPEDMPIFTGILADIFPGTQLPGSKRNEAFERNLKKACSSQGMQPEEGILTKCRQLNELLTLRHCVMIIGNPATGKTTTRKVLLESFRIRKLKYVDKVINPKSVTTAELFGSMDHRREWKDGLASSIIRTCAAIPAKEYSWIVFDGDIDTEWVESLNSAMDDNKVLTLASNDRIQIPANMTLLFEIHNMRYATPATVSRAGMLHMSTTDIGWLPYVQSWFDQKKMASTITPLLDKYVQRCLDWIMQEGKTTIPQSEYTLVRNLCAYVDLLLKKDQPQTGGLHSEREAEHWFIFACIWALGGTLTTEGNYRQRFDTWWRQEWKALKFPEAGTVFDYCLSEESKKLEKWSDIVKKQHAQQVDKSTPHKFVTTASTAVVSYFFDRMVQTRQPVLLVGGDGVGKTLLVQDRMRHLPETTTHHHIAFTYYTSSAELQAQLQLKLERKMGRRWGPVGRKNLIWMLDDINFPQVDAYGAQSAIELMRQFLDYDMWYQKQRWQPITIADVQTVAIMNPTKGSYMVNPRFQRHFVCLQMPNYTRETATFIFSRMLAEAIGPAALGQVAAGGLDKASRCVEKIVESTLDVHECLKRDLSCTSLKFYYHVSMRQLSHVFEGVVHGIKQRGFELKSSNIVSLWLHELHRGYSDWLLDQKDVDTFSLIVKKTCETHLAAESKLQALLGSRLLYGSFAGGEYRRFDDIAAVTKAITGHKRFDQSANMVVFEQAAEQVLRCARVLEKPGGHLLLMGVGGCGKQSIARMAAALCGYTLTVPKVAAAAASPSFHDDLKNIFVRSGVKGEGVVLMVTEAHILRNEMLADISALLSTGDVPDLFPPEDREEVIRRVRSEVRSLAIVDTADNCWAHFIDNVQHRLHVALCFHPGPELRQRARMFPALFACTVQNIVQPWDENALVAVAERGLHGVNLGLVGLTSQELSAARQQIAQTMALMHRQTNAVAEDFTRTTNAPVCITSRTFAEFVSTYVQILGQKLRDMDAKKEKLEAGVAHLQRASSDATTLQQVLVRKQNQVAEKRQQVDELLNRLSQEKTIVSIENTKADAEEAKALEMQKLVAMKTVEMEEDLAKAEPLAIAAQNALECITKSSVLELKALKQPPPEVQAVMACVLILLSPAQIARDKSWPAAQKAMARVEIFLQSLRTYKKDAIPDSHIAQLRPYLASPDFNPDLVSQRSPAAGYLCEWVRNVVKYHELYCYIQPKRESVLDGKMKFEEAQQKVARIKMHVEKLHMKYGELEYAAGEAQRERDEVVAEAKAMEDRLELSKRMVHTLDGEQGKWRDGATDIADKRNCMAGDVLLASAMVCYAGPFTGAVRATLIEDRWRDSLRLSGISYTDQGLDPVKTLTTMAQLAEWHNQNLPLDTVSVQNACICHHSRRPVLFLDPQFQGLAWIQGTMLDSSQAKDEEKKERKRVQLSVAKKRNMVLTRQGEGLKDVLAEGISYGGTVVVEKMGELLDPLVRGVLKRESRSNTVVLEDREVVRHPDFKLILHTRQRHTPFKQDIHAELCVLNFAVPADGLEEQLLTLVMNKEKKDLEQRKRDILYCTNKYQINIAELEDGLINKISSSADAVIDAALVTSLEQMKEMATELYDKIAIARKTEETINEAREQYRPVARRGALLYFLLLDLEKLEWLYQYSLHSFALLFLRAIEVNFTQIDLADDHGTERVKILVSEVTLVISKHVKRGILGKHRQVFELLLCLVIARDAGVLPKEEHEFLMSWSNTPAAQTPPPCSWITQEQWDNLCYLAQMKRFESLNHDIAKRLKRWKDWITSEKPEDERLPGDARYLGTFEKMLVVKVLRPDRLGAAAVDFCKDVLGEGFTKAPVVSMTEVIRDTNPMTPVLFILFPGADPLKEIEVIAHKMGLNEQSGNLRTIAMGEGQEELALESLRECASSGGWVILANLHLMGAWLATFEGVFEDLLKRPHKDFRVFFTAEPSSNPEYHLPQGIVQTSLKCLSHEPSMSLQASMQKSWGCFSSEQVESSLKSNEHKRLLFALSYFHSAVVCRRRFGEHGWSKPYAFATSDLAASSQILSNYLDPLSPVIPWGDVKYILGEITYGGHITDTWDRRTLHVLLDTVLGEEYLQTGELAPDLLCPMTGNYQQYAQFIEQGFPQEKTALLHMHPNAEMWYLTQQAKAIVGSLSMLCRDGSEGETGLASRDPHLREMLDGFYNRLPENFAGVELTSGAPVAAFIVQEVERFNALLSHVRETLCDCLLGLRGGITISPRLDAMLEELHNGAVPLSWRERSYPSLCGLKAWFEDLLLRYQHMEGWVQQMALPVCVWISALFNPRAFLMVILQTSARKTGVAMDELKICTDVVKKCKEDLTTAPREGAYIHGLYLEGAGWDYVAGNLEDPALKVLHPMLPVLYIKAVPEYQAVAPTDYPCPVYHTTARGDSYVFTAHLKAPTASLNTWVLRGTCAVMSPVQA